MCWHIMLEPAQPDFLLNCLPNEKKKEPFQQLMQLFENTSCIYSKDYCKFKPQKD